MSFDNPYDKSISFAQRFQELQKRGAGKTIISKEVLQTIDRRWKAGMDNRIIIQGEAGIGKSLGSLRICEYKIPLALGNPQLFIDRSMTFKAVDFMRAVTYLQPFEALIFDEPVQELNHREFMQSVNILLIKTLGSFRYKKLLSIFNVPNIDLIDADARKLCQFMIFIDKHGHGEVFKILPQKFGGNVKYKKIIDNLHISLPSKELIKAYENKKKAYEGNEYESYLAQMIKKETPKVSNDDMATSITTDPSKFVKKIGGQWRVYPPYIQTVWDIGRNRADVVKSIVERDMNLQTYMTKKTKLDQLQALADEARKTKIEHIGDVIE